MFKLGISRVLFDHYLKQKCKFFDLRNEQRFEYSLYSSHFVSQFCFKGIQNACLCIPLKLGKNVYIIFCKKVHQRKSASNLKQTLPFKTPSTYIQLKARIRFLFLQNFYFKFFIKKFLKSGALSFLHLYERIFHFLFISFLFRQALDRICLTVHVNICIHDVTFVSLKWLQKMNYFFRKILRNIKKKTSKSVCT